MHPHSTHAATARRTRARRAAYHATAAAIAAGILVPKACERCGTVPVAAHHPDYAAPLRVTWLCSWCHWGEHHPGRARRPRPTA